MGVVTHTHAYDADPDTHIPKRPRAGRGETHGCAWTAYRHYEPSALFCGRRASLEGVLTN